ncbi:MAG: hypothetical protein JXM70_19650 [Pirellulales bacterium]|nr:hypothetical protein [Pirellulales bacterium]
MFKWYIGAAFLVMFIAAVIEAIFSYWKECKNNRESQDNPVISESQIQNVDTKV